MKRRKFIAYISKHGCELKREGAKHSWWWNPSTGSRSAVPRHREIDDLLARKICKELDVPTP